MIPDNASPSEARILEEYLKDSNPKAVATRLYYKDGNPRRVQQVIKKFSWFLSNV